MGDIFRAGIDANVQHKKSSLEENLYGYAQKRIREIYNEVEKKHQIMKRFNQKRVTKLNNEALAKTAPQIQKEMMRGHYTIHLQDHMPYS